jgi:hypothetical protein
MALRVNIRKLKQLLWFSGVLAFAYAGWTFYDIYSAKQAGEYTARKLKVFEDILKRDIDDASRNKHKAAAYVPDRYEKVWQALVNGEVRKGPEELGPPVDPTPAAPVVPPLAEVVEISTVLYAHDPLLRFVALSYKDEAGAGAGGGAGAAGKVRQLHLSEGDPLKPPYDAPPFNGKVLAIGSQEIKFMWGEGEATITPQLGVAGQGLPFDQFAIPADEDPLQSMEAPAQSVEIAPGKWVIGTDDIARIQSDPQAFLAEELKVRTVTPPNGGRSSLEVLEDPPAGSLAAQYGVKAKDRLISVNGIPMSSLSTAANWFKSNDNLSQYVIVFERAGEQNTMTVYAK